MNLLVAVAAIAVGLPFFWLFRGFACWIVLSFLVYWSLAAALIAFAWKEWAQARPQMDAEGMRDDRPFLIGQILGTLNDKPPKGAQWEPLGDEFENHAGGWYSLQRLRYRLTVDEWGYA